MTSPGLAMELSIARCRLVLSLFALVAIYVDPAEPTIGAFFVITPNALGMIGAHFAYSLVVLVALRKRLASAEQAARVTAWGDVVFATGIALVTEGTSSPFYVFFAFALVTVGFRSGLRRAVVITSVSVAVYLALLLFGDHPDQINFHIMRPAYLAVLGYLVGYMGEQQLRLGDKVRELEAAAQRDAIARSLHDGYNQSLAGVNLRLETCRELLHRGKVADTLRELGELQNGVIREYDDLRAYIRSLADRDLTPAGTSSPSGTRYAVQAQFAGSADFVEHVLQILREGALNVRRHARARSASMTVRMVGAEVLIQIDDDGVGFRRGPEPPWSIASRARELAGSVRVGDGPGGHVLVALPQGATV
jgi:signal transduction histidine kinase